jgi:lysyl-tRNA synthetase class 2
MKLQAHRLKMLQRRSGLLAAIRGFFLKQDFIEVETPVRLPAPALERYINAIPAGDWYLRTSPELHMKRLLVDGVSPIFQMGPCFRAGEHGNRHRTEFTMLEWYRTDADYRDILSDTEALNSARGSIAPADGNNGF